MKSVLSTMDSLFDAANSSKSGKSAGSTIVAPSPFMVSSDALNAATTAELSPSRNLRGTPSRFPLSPFETSAAV